jgi:hypothetical protein
MRLGRGLCSRVDRLGHFRGRDERDRPDGAPVIRVNHVGSVRAISPLTVDKDLAVILANVLQTHTRICSVESHVLSVVSTHPDY